MNNPVLFRFDASEKVGIGHAMRCLSVIEQIKKYHVNVIVCAQQLPDYISEKFKIIDVPVLYQQGEVGSSSDLQELLDIVNNYSASTVVLDGYFFKKLYRQKLKENISNVVTFDDVNDLKQLYCDLIINALITANMLGYESSAAQAKHLIGLQYSIIRAEFLSLSLIPLEDRKCLLVNFGGSDVNQLTLPVIKLLAQNKSLVASAKIIVVTGGSCKNIKSIIDVCQKNGFEHHHNTNEISRLMNQSALAICAPGGTIYELAYCQVPSILLTVADNQKLSAKAHQAADWCKVFDGTTNSILPSVVSMASEFWKDKDKLKKMSKSASELIDGKGADRIAEQIIKLNDNGAQHTNKGTFDE